MKREKFQRNFSLKIYHVSNKKKKGDFENKTKYAGSYFK